jgi:hypothetical protein
MANDRHTVTIWSVGDEIDPMIKIECPYDLQSANRPCAEVDCPQCAEYSTIGCLDEGHDGAHIIDGLCGYQEWNDNDGVVLEYDVRLRVAQVHWDSDGITLKLKAMGQ